MGGCMNCGEIVNQGKLSCIGKKVNLRLQMSKALATGDNESDHKWVSLSFHFTAYPGGEGFSRLAGTA